MSSQQNKGTFQPDSDVHITYEDQQKINKYARLNAKLDDLREDIKQKENDLKNLEEACDEVSLMDDEEMIPYLVGEIFIYHNSVTTQECLEQAKKEVQGGIDELRNSSTKVQNEMGDLKSHLYGKFGSHINLEKDD